MCENCTELQGKNEELEQEIIDLKDEIKSHELTNAKIEEEKENLEQQIEDLEEKLKNIYSEIPFDIISRNKRYS